MPVNSTKQCSKCEKEKNQSDFSTNRHHRDGLQSYCRACGAKYLRQHRHLTRRHREEHREEINHQQRERYWQNHAKELDRRRKAYHGDSANGRAIGLRNYYNHRDEITAKRKSAEGRAASVIYRRTRRAREKGVTVSAIRSLSQMIKEQGGKCYLCGKRFTKMDPAVIEHYIPLARGGEHTDANIMAAHRSCNGRKHVLQPEVYANQVGKLLV